MIDLPKKTEYIRVRHCRLVTTPQLEKRYAENIDVLNKAYQYTIKYLEKTYGYRHLNRPYPTDKKGKIYVIKDQIMPRFLHDVYHIDKWNGKKVPIHSQALRDEFMVSIMTNFGEYRKVLKKAAKMTKQEKEDYRNNKYGNNPQHRSWYRKGSLAYLRNGKSHTTVSLPSNGQIEVLSAHHIKIQDYGNLQTIDNIKHFKHLTIVTSKIKRKSDGLFELQLVLKDQHRRRKPTKKIGADWNMKDNKIFHTSENQRIYLNPKVSVDADKYEHIINNLKSQRSHLEKFLNHKSSRLIKLTELIHYYNVRRTNVLTEAYRHMAKKLFEGYNLIAIEQLDAKEMRRESTVFNKTGNHAKNRKLAKIKPYELSQLLTQVANREGKTLIKVDSYKTSQVEYGTDYQEKHDPTEREWVSKYTSKKIIRDLNASQNILAWALEPKKHIKYRERQAAIRQAKEASVDETELPKEIKANWLIEINSKKNCKH